MSDTDHANTASTLNTLVETAKDGANGYRSAAAGVKDEALKSLFTTLSEQRDRFAEELQAAVGAMGAKPEQSGSAIAVAHRGWLDVKSLVTGRDDAAVLAECERGDGYAVKAYDEAIATGLPASVVQLVQRQAAEVRRAHAQVHALHESRSAKPVAK